MSTNNTVYVDNKASFLYTTIDKRRRLFMKKSKLSVQDMCMIAASTAIIAIMAQISIPMPLGVPMTMQTFAITFAAIVLGAKNSAIASLLYVLLGTIGVPVFANFTGGYDKVIGPTGGFLISFPIMALLIGLGMDLHMKSRKMSIVAMVIGIVVGTIVNYIAGIVWFCVVMDSSFKVGFEACVLPFIPTAILKAILAVVVGLPVRKAVRKATCR